MKLIQGIPPHTDDWYVQHDIKLYGPYSRFAALELMVQLGSDFPRSSVRPESRKKRNWSGCKRRPISRKQACIRSRKKSCGWT